jgi:hypothetical protein
MRARLHHHHLPHHHHCASCRHLLKQKWDISVIRKDTTMTNLAGVHLVFHTPTFILI